MSRYDKKTGLMINRSRRNFFPKLLGLFTAPSIIGSMEELDEQVPSKAEEDTFYPSAVAPCPSAFFFCDTEIFNKNA